MIMCIQNLVLIGLFVFKILSKNSILTSIKGRNSVVNLPKFELIQAFMHVRIKKIQLKTSSPKGNDRSPESQHVIIKTNSDMNQGTCYPVANLRKTTIYNTKKNLVNDDVYTKFGLILSICSQDIE